MSYPEDLKTTIDKLSNYSRSSVKVQNQTSGDVIDGDNPVFRLPSNSLIDLSSSCVHAKMVTGPTGGVNAGGSKVPFLPCRDLDVIRRLTVEVNNQMLN